MKIKELLEEIKECKKVYGRGFLNWDIYTEQIGSYDRKQKKASKWEWITDSEEWEYFKCNGFFTKFPDKKIFTINVNY